MLGRMLQGNTNNMFVVQMRAFGPKGKPAGGPIVSAYVPPKVIPTNFEAMVAESGIDQFMFGPPSGIEKRHNSHRDYVAPKIGSRMEFAAKKMREQYIREAIYPDVKIYLDTLRERQPEDNLIKLHADMQVAAVINARDEFDDLDLVFPNRTPYTIRKTDHGLVRPFYVRHNDEEIMVTVNDIKKHFKTNKPILIDF